MAIQAIQEHKNILYISGITSCGLQHHGASQLVHGVGVEHHIDMKYTS